MDGGTDTGLPDGGEEDAPSDANTPDGSDDAAMEELHVFPPRDFVCPAESSPPCETTMAALSPADRTEELTSSEPITVTYVLDDIRIPQAGAVTAVGFNLDGLDSGREGDPESPRCDRYTPDFESTDGERVGVDNAFSGLIPTFEGIAVAPDCPEGVSRGCMDAAIREAVHAGTMLVLLEVTDMNDATNDDDVGVALYAASVEGGGAPLIESDGRLASGQRFVSTSLLAATVRGDVFRGVLRAQWPTVQFAVPPLTAGVRIPLGLDQVELRFSVGSDEGLGELGGSREVSTLVEELSDEESAATVGAVLSSVADLDPSEDDPGSCRTLSFGYALQGVTAVRVP